MTSPNFAARLATAISSIAVVISIASVSANARAEPVAVSGVVEVDAFRRIHEGMTASEVRSLLGAPSDTMRFPLSRTTAWDYPFHDTWGYDSDFSVIIDDSDVVVGTVATRRDEG